MAATTSVIYTIRNRDTERLRNSAMSLLKHERNGSIDVIVVDFGSDGACADRVRSLCAELGIKRIRTETGGLPWSRGRALNIGICQASTPYIATTDIDILFKDDPLAVSLERIGPDKKIQCATWFLPPNGSQDRAWPGDHGQLGGYMFMGREQLIARGGFNEDIIYWGMEDVELHERLTALGFETEWIEDQVRMYHVWHPVSYGLLDRRPLVSVVDGDRALAEALAAPESYAPSEIGKVLTLGDRPILPLLHSETSDACEVLAPPNGYFGILSRLLEIGSRERFVHVDLGPIYRSSYLRKIAQPHFRGVIRVVESIERRLGVTIRAELNTNLNSMLISLPLLRSHGLIDYYISADESAVWMLFQ